jgi:GNAT superfamily N-acetyltransferase
MTMTVRPARLPADEPAILGFIAALQKYEAGFEKNRRTDKDFPAEHWGVVQNRVHSHHGLILVAEDGGKIQGWLFAYEENAEVFIAPDERVHGFLAEIYVVPEARGTGVGRALIEACEIWSKGRGHKALTINVLAHNARAIRAYEGTGYAPYTVTLRKYL